MQRVAPKREREQVLGHPVAGASWEGFAIEILVAVAGDRRTPYFYRTEDGAEIDLLFERAGSVDMVIESKRSTAPTLSRGFNLARQALKPREAYLVHGGTRTQGAGERRALPLEHQGTCRPAGMLAHAVLWSIREEGAKRTRSVLHLWTIRAC